MLKGLVTFTLLLIGLTLSSTVAGAQPATSSSERVDRFGYWYVVKKPATYIIAGTGQRGRYTLCSAILFAKTGSLEFEAKNETAWSFYVAEQRWDYSFATGSLTLKSGSQEIRIPAALYGGPMISGTSHDIRGGARIPMETLRSFVSQGEPISFHDSQGRKLITFPNNGSDLSKALDQAIKCSLTNAPK